jgi:homopolymeric O-antigen transport system ATP-binding protein
VTDFAVRVEGLGKRYRLGQRERYRSLRDTLARAVIAPLRRANSQDDDKAGTFWALKDIDFDLRQGEVLGVIGRNGAGKSTLLKILSRITEPTAGRVELFGRVGSLLEVGTGFHPELTGRENVYLNGAILGMTREEIARKFDEIVAFAEVEAFLDTAVKHFSSGMYMRLAFAVAAHLEPEILVVDEVLAVGDAAFQKKCLGKMSEVARAGRTVLFVSHNMNAVEDLCQAVLLLDRGRSPGVTTDVRAAVTEYLFGAGTASVSEWRNPGGELANPWFCPERFWIGDAAGRPATMPVRNDAEVYVYIEGRAERLDPAMNVGYALCSAEGELLYWSMSTDAAEAAWPAVRVGANRFRSRLPARLLNEGDYRLEMNCSLHCREWFVRPGVNAPSVVLTIHGGLSDSPYWMTRRPGALAPVHSWEAV